MSSCLIQLKFQRHSARKERGHKVRESKAQPELWHAEGKTESCLFLLFLTLIVWAYCRNHEGKYLYLAQESEKVEKDPVQM